MKTYYCVTSAIYDSGRIVVAITDSKEAETKPEDTRTAKNDRDIYEDWFDSIEEAKEFVEESKNA
jgi:hypothetical protein